MNLEILASYCKTQTTKKWQTATALFKTKRYADCLFFCHLSLEFALKEKMVSLTKRHFPLTHDLEFLAKKTRLPFNQEQFKQLAIISTFNIAGRYDDYKLSFYKKATTTFAEQYLLITKDLLQWLKKQ